MRVAGMVPEEDRDATPEYQRNDPADRLSYRLPLHWKISNLPGRAVCPAHELTSIDDSETDDGARGDDCDHFGFVLAHSLLCRGCRDHIISYNHCHAKA